MRREELDQLVDWAAAEGWNPGLCDADIFWHTDPEGFIAAESGGLLTGGGSIVSYDGRFGFMGFFIVHPQHRGHGLGTRLWNERLRLLRARLLEPVVIGMDGVFEMQDYYARGGFRYAGRDLRFEGRGSDFPVSEQVVGLGGIPFAQVDAYDRAHFPAPRSDFLQRWIAMPGSHARAVLRKGRLSGFGVMRACRNGHKIGPLFADDAQAADDLYRSLVSQVAGEAVFIDVPEANADALALANRYDMNEVFGCARMYYGPAPDLPEREIFGVTTFELG
jgi:ribosomal protein S18 acetylase RimI-like enzyme